MATGTITCSRFQNADRRGAGQAPILKEDMMALGKHERTETGRFRRERADSLAKNLAKEYPEFEQVHGSTKLGTLKDQFGVDSLNGVRLALRRQDK